MDLIEWIEQLRRAGVNRVTLDLEVHGTTPVHLLPDPVRGSHHADQAPRTAQAGANAQAESHAAQSSDESEEDQEAPPERDLDLAHLP